MVRMTRGTAKRSAGLLLYRAPAPGAVEVLIVHPGGPFWSRRDEGAWTIPKGELDAGEDPLAAARREFREELGIDPPDAAAVSLGEVRLKSGKWVQAWAVPGDLDVTRIESNEFETEWPPKSGRMASFPEVDRASWFTVDAARSKLNPAQAAFLDRLEEQLGRV
jgi:predicted NUDIX family NTP pyrophosphohydrolase